MKPLDARATGLGDRARPAPTEAQDVTRMEPPPTPRMVGGGRALPGVAPQGATALAEALDKLDRVKDGDAPAVLFDRMNRAEGQPRTEQHGKNW